MQIASRYNTHTHTRSLHFSVMMPNLIDTNQNKVDWLPILYFALFLGGLEFTCKINNIMGTHVV